MKAKIVYGCPCSGKSTYVREHVGDSDLIYDYDALIQACTNRTAHTTDRHKGHFVVLGLRWSMVNKAREEGTIDTLWMQCRWPTDTIHKILEGIDTEEIFIKATKEECYDRLDKDDSRPDKEAWWSIIDAWFDEHDESTMNSFVPYEIMAERLQSIPH